MKLEDKVVWITGAARRLGRAMALAVAERGADVVVHFRSSGEEAADVCAQIEALGRRALAVQADLTNVSQIRELGQQIQAHFGRLDVFVNNASTFERTPLAEIDEAAWDANLDVNLKGPAFCALEAARLMQLDGESAGGKIINMADSAAMRPYPNFLPYMIAKGGIITLTRALAVELAPAISVNAIAPGPVLLPESASEEEIARAVARVPLGRVGTPEDIVATLLWLLEGTDYTTGQIICIDGGRSVSTI